MELFTPRIGPGVRTFVHSTIFNRNVGSQQPDPVFGPIFFTSGEVQLCDDGVDLSGMIVLVDKSDSVLWDLPSDIVQLECAYKAGAMAMINAYDLIAEPGMGYRLFAPQTSIPIPLFHVALQAIPADILTEIKASGSASNVTANVTADPNAWTELWDSQSFHILWTILLPILNVMGMVLAALGIGLLGRLLFQRENQAGSLTRVRRFNIRLLITGNVIMFLTSSLRFYYCINGPLYKSTTRTMAFHFILLNITVVWEVIASIIGIAIFIRWASFGIPPKEKLFNKIMAIMAAAGFPIYLVVTVLDFLKVAPITAVLQPLLMTAASVIVGAVYLYRTILFLLRTYQHRHRKGGSYVSRMRIGLLMMFAAMMNVILVIALLIALLPTFFFTVTGRFQVYSLVFISLTLQAVSQTLAFMPSLLPLFTRRTNGTDTVANAPRTGPLSRRASAQDRRFQPSAKVVYPQDVETGSTYTVAEVISDRTMDRVSKKSSFRQSSQILS